MLPYILTFAAVAVLPLLLAGYGGHLATIALRDSEKRKALLIVWVLALGGVVLFGVTQVLAYRSDKKRDEKDGGFRTGVLMMLQRIIDEPDTAKKKEAAVAFKDSLTDAKAIDSKAAPKPLPVRVDSRPVNTSQQPEASDPEAQLLERSVEVVRSCHSFLRSSGKRMQEAQAKIQRHNSRPNITEQSKQSFSQWQMELLHRDDMQLYGQVYKQEFMDVRRLLVMRVPDAVEPSVDYDNPHNMGGVTGICYDLSNLAEAYVNREYAQGKITIEDGRKYLALLNR
jgi:hypothetical protein